jgi:hypothetical protein
MRRKGIKLSYIALFREYGSDLLFIIRLTSQSLRALCKTVGLLFT